MHRRRTPVILFGIGLLFVVGAAPAFAQTERIRSYHVVIEIERDGSIDVLERIAYDFGAEPRHGIFREIPVRFRFDETYDRIYRIEDIGVDASVGTPHEFTTETEDGTFRIKIGDPDETITGVHSYDIRYRVRGALNGFRDHDELFWNAIGTDWTVPIGRASAEVRAPGRITRVECFAGSFGSTAPCDSARTRDETARFAHGTLAPSEGLTVVVAIPRGIVPVPRPILDERWSFGRAFSVTPVTITLTLAIAALLLGGIARMIWIAGRDRRFAGSAIDAIYGSPDGREQRVPLFEDGATPVEYGPPDRIRPGQVGTLVDEVANPLDVTATIVDLAVRGYLRIEEIPKRGLFGKADWRLVKLKEPDDELLAYERKLLDGLFEAGEEDAEADARDGLESGSYASLGRDDGLARVRLSSLRTKFVTRLKDVQETLYRDAVARGWFSDRPDKVREKWQQRGFLLLLAGGGLTYLVASRTHFGLLPIPLALGGLMLMAGSNAMPRRTPKGTGLVRRVFGFRNYIETAERREAQFQERENIFSRYLPYAIVFGCTEKWARAFAQLADRPPDTSWYVGARPFTVSAFSSSIDHFTVSTAGTIASTPSGSGSSGFGGGGFSGGGGGGGGGGSW